MRIRQLSQSPVRVLIADDHVPVRERIAALLAEHEGVEIVGQTGGVGNTLAAIHSLKPNVVTLDLRLADGSGLDILRITRGSVQRPAFIVMTSHPTTAYALEAKRLEAYAFLDKARDFDRLPQLVREIGGGDPGRHAGQAPRPGFVADWAMDASHGRMPPAVR